MAAETDLLILIIWISVALWVIGDAKKRGKNAYFWGFFSFFLLIIFVPLYLLIRPKGKIIRCRYCAKEMLETLPQCPHCKGKTSFFPAPKITRVCENCGKISDDLIYSDDMLLCEKCRIEEESKDIEFGEKLDYEGDAEIARTNLPTYTLIIEIKNKLDREPVPKASVILRSDIEEFERTSDVDGKVIFGKVKEGVYTLIIDIKGFEQIIREISLMKNERITIELKGKACITIHVLDGINRKTIPDARIRIGENEIRTDENGVALIKDISLGKYELTIEKDSYKLETSSMEVKDLNQDIQIFLKPEIKLSDEFFFRGDKLRNSMKESMQKLSLSCDMCIPEYYMDICNELIKFDEIIASTPAYAYADQSSDKIEALYKVTGQICKEMELILTNSENITEYITIARKGIKVTQKISINQSDYGIAIQSYMSDPGNFLRTDKSKILHKLQNIDSEITRNYQNFNINPMANLWSICQKLISGSKNEYEEAASLLLVNILLDATKKMLNSPEMIRLLKTNSL